MKRTQINNRIIWILLAFFIWYLVVGSMFMEVAMAFLRRALPPVSNAMNFVLEYYTPLIFSVLFFLIFCLISGKNRFLLKIVKPTREGRSFSRFGIGILLGFLTNFFCILCALIHGDIKLYFDFSSSQIPVMVFAFICVFFQSTSEELWCRTFMYERINVHYPLWVAIVVNSTVFGLLHSFNPGLTALAMADLIICGLAYSLLRWYSGSIWTCMGIHTMWNFTQNFLFGLPNSGLVSEASVMHLDAATGISNLIYSYDFGVEGAVPAIFIDLLMGAVILWMAKKEGRLGELLESYESRGEMPVLPPKEMAEIVESDSPAEDAEAVQVSESDAAASVTEGKTDITEDVEAVAESKTDITEDVAAVTEGEIEAQ